MRLLSAGGSVLMVGDKEMLNVIFMLRHHYVGREESLLLGYFTTMEGWWLPWSQYCKRRQHLLYKKRSNSLIYKWRGLNPNYLVMNQ